MSLKKVIILGLAIIFVLGLGLVIYRVVTGRSLGSSAIVHWLRNTGSPMQGHSEVIKYNTGQFTNIIFIHHSVGNNLIHQGNLREQFQKVGFSMWDQDYMEEGLTRPDGSFAGYSYDVPGDNTDIDGYAAIFQQPVYDQPVNTFSALLQYEVILFKSCFPNNQIDDDAALEKHKQEYLSIRQSIDQHPDHIFFLLTSPPLNPAETNKEAAGRARALANWLNSPEYIDGHPNLFVFNFFDLLAEKDQAVVDANMLKLEYRNGNDSHPNSIANQKIAPLLVSFVYDKVSLFRKTNR